MRRTFKKPSLARRWAMPAALLTCLAAPAQAQEAGQLNIICSVQAEWCNLIQTVYARSTGVKVNMSLKGSGEALAQLVAHVLVHEIAHHLGWSDDDIRRIDDWTA